MLYTLLLITFHTGCEQNRQGNRVYQQDEKRYYFYLINFNEVKLIIVIVLNDRKGPFQETFSVIGFTI